MPTNLAENALSALKIGNENVTAAYAGNLQIFPNTTELTSWDGWYPYTQVVASTTAHNVGVYGDIGATYQITGTNQNVANTGPVAGTISQPGRNLLSIPIVSNDVCGNPQRQLGANIAVTGDTTLAAGFGSTQSFITQAAGPATYSFTGSGSSLTVAMLNYVPIQIGSSLRFGVGTKWRISYVFGGGTYSPSTPPSKAVPSFSLSGVGLGNTHSGSFTNVTQPSGAQQFGQDSVGTYIYQRWNVVGGGYANDLPTGTYSFEHEITSGTVSSVTWYAGVYVTLFPYGSTTTTNCGSTTGVDFNTFAITPSNQNYP